MLNSGHDMSDTLTKRRIAEYVSNEMGFSVRSILDIVDQLFECMQDTLMHGKDIKIVRFGTFTAIEKGARKGVNLATGEPVTIPARRKVVFRPSRTLKGMVNARTGEKILQDR